jgi:hypothetical protein
VNVHCDTEIEHPFLKGAIYFFEVKNLPLLSVMRSNPVKVASWSMRKVLPPTSARTSDPTPPVRLSP